MAVHIREPQQQLIHRRGSCSLCFVKNLKKHCELRSKVAAVWLCACLNELGEEPLFPHASVVSEHEQQQTCHQHRCVMSLVPRTCKFFVEVAHQARCFDVRFLFFFVAELTLAVSGNESEPVYFFGKVCKRKSKWCVVPTKISYAEVPEVRGDDDTREVLNVDALEVVNRLGFCSCEILAGRLMFSNERAWPEKVNTTAPTSGLTFGSRFESSYALPVNAENAEELIPKGLRLGVLVVGPFPSGRKLLSVGSNFVPRRRLTHGARLLKSSLLGLLDDS